MCSVCQGYTGIVCPVCGRGALEERECPECKGLGHTGYYAFDIIERKDIKCTESAWIALPQYEDSAERLGKRYCRQEVDPCWRCGGEGFVLV